MADGYRGGPVIAEVVRSGFVESVHRGSVAVIGADGASVVSVGDTTGQIFPRSATKPLQAAGMLRAGLQPAEAADLALIAASHRGEPLHVERVRAMLSRAGLGEQRLRCPPSTPLADACGELSRVSHNCSGKHAGMLLTCLAAGWPLAGYLDPGHPVQGAIRDFVAEAAGETIGATGVDGCGAPVLSLSLHALARAVLGLVSSASAEGTRVADAMRAHPELVSGTGPHAHDTVLMRGTPGLLAKGGAEGVHAVAVPGVGAVTIKVDDGAKRALMPVLAWGLAKLGLDALTPAEPVLGGDEPVGAVCVSL